MPPVFGKEEMIRASWILLIFSIALSHLFPVDIYLNGSLYKSYTTAELNDLAYYIPAEPGLRQGISLGEILPLMIQAYQLDAGPDQSSARTWKEDCLAERLSRWYLVSSDTEGNWDLLIHGELCQDIRRLDIRGEKLSQDSLEVWVSWEGIPLLKEEISRFERLHNVSIKVLNVPKTKSKLIAVLRGKGKLPDVVMIQSDYLPSLTKAKALQNLDYMDSTYLSEKGLKAFRLNGKTWAIPFYFDTQLVFYNRKLISLKPSPGWTLLDFESTALDAAQRQKGIIPLAWNAYSAYWLIPFQTGFGKNPFIEADGSLRINDTATIKALEYIMDLQSRRLLQVMERDAMISLFSSGKIAMILSGSYSIPLFTELGLDFDIAPFPFNSETKKALSPLLDYKALAITRKTHNPILSRRLIQYLTGIGVQQRFPIILSKMPADPKAWQIMKEKNRYHRALTQSSAIGIPVPTEKSYTVYKSTMWKLLRLALTGQMSVREVLTKGQQIIDSKSSR